MAYENLCMYCFKDLNGETVCPHCGGDSRAAVPQIQLLPGTLVYRERFLVGRALGQDSGGIVYNALDTKRGGVIRIREYLPRNCAERLNDGGVVPVAGMEDAFETGMRKLRASVESVEDPRQRHFYFEENGTAYIAQRKGVGASQSREEEDDDGAGDRRKQILLYVAIAAAIVVAVAIVAILFFNSLGSTDDRTLDNPPETVEASESATWAPAATPTPTPYATPTFAALIDPELSWMDYTGTGEVDEDLEKQLEGTPTKKPELEGNENYPTVNAASDEVSVRDLQHRLVQLGWLNYSDVSGKYDSNTKSAVREFQKYVNEHCSPAVKLVEDGIAGKKTQQWLYNSSVSLIRPTATPKPKVTADPDAGLIDGTSPASKIRNLQNKLIKLGILPEGSADGKFGSATQNAVKSFQRQVNRAQGYIVLEMNGVANALTLSWLDYYVAEWELLQKATATPRVTDTPKPTPTPTASPVPGGSGQVDASSTREEILAVQKLLQQVGLLNSGDADGVYGLRTADAVRKFQNWINQLRGEETLDVTGAVDDLTLRYLQYCVENGRMYDLPEGSETPEPAFEPDATEAPDPTEVPPEQQAGEGGITPDSPTESIEFMQEMLSEIGLLDAEYISGRYDAETQVAVRAFQLAVNERYGAGLDVSGNCDTETLRYLQQAYDDGEDFSASFEPEPTESPTEVPPIDGVAPYSPEEDILDMQRMLVRVNLLEDGQDTGVYDEDTEEAVRGLQRAANAYNKKEVLQVTGQCDSKTLEYLQIASKRKLDLSKLAAETGEDSAEPGESAEPDEAGETDEFDGETDEFGDEADEFGDEAGSFEDVAPEPFEDEEAPEPSDTATPEPSATPAPTDTPAPTVGTIASIHFAVSGAEAGGQVELEPGSHEITWGAEGDVQSYYVYLYNGAEQLIQQAENTQLTGFSMNTSSMVPGEVYELRVGAMPVNGTPNDVLWQSIQLVLPQQITPEPTFTPTPAPTVGAPVINLGSTAYQLDGVQYVSSGTAIFSWMADGQVGSYTVDLTYENDGTDYSLGTTTDTSKTVNTAQLRPGTYLLRVGATPMGANADATVWSELRFAIPEPEATPEPVQQEFAPETEPPEVRISYLDVNSNPEDIQTVQMALYGQGLLDAQAVQPGVLDQSTLQAIAAFQQKVNETMGYQLYVLDPLVDTSVDAQTLDLLLYQNLDLAEQW